MKLWSEVWQDARYALRGMRRTPGFAAVAILTMALGIGANTAVFSVLYGVSLAPARYAHSEQLVDISLQQLSGHRFRRGTSAPNLADWRAQASSIQEFAVHRYRHQLNVTGKEGPEEVVGHRVSANMFPMLGVGPVAGHHMDAAADRAAGPRQAYIDNAWWRRRYGGDAGIVGRQIRVDDQEFTVVGVMPDGFVFPPLSTASYRPVIWLSMNLPAEEENSREARVLSVVARLKRSPTVQRKAQVEMMAISRRLAEAYPKENGDWGARVSPLVDSSDLGEVPAALLLVMAAAVLVLLIACANIANLLLARGAGREREMAVRRALGVTGGRLARQLLAESCVLAVCGGMAGILLAYAVLPLLKSLLPASMPRVDEIALNGTLLLFAAGASIVTGLVFGLVPALRLSRDGERSFGSRAAVARRGTARLLVVSEVVLAFVLAASAGLLLVSFYRASTVELGFLREHTLTMRLNLSARRYADGQRVRTFREELLRRVSALPGVRYAATVSALPMGILAQGTEFQIEGSTTAGPKPFASYANVSTDYLRAMGISILAGRDFAESDGPSAEPVAIVSERLARDCWRAGQALNQRIRFDETSFRIVGIARDVRQDSPERAPRGQIYALNHQLPLSSQGGAMGRFNILVVRMTPEGIAGVGAMRQAVAAVDKDQPVAAITTLEQLVDKRLSTRRLITVLVSIFAGLALLLAVVGVYGVSAHSVERRTKEFGIRMALGATPVLMARMIAREVVLLGMAGLCLGGVGMALGARLLEFFLYSVERLDLAIPLAVGFALLGVVLGGSLIPARRAMWVDPMTALRAE
jgi:putative ABC transport system permease protein